MKKLIQRIGVSLGLGNTVNFIIGGAQKAGTTALFDMLSHHSFLYPAFTRKEQHYFYSSEYSHTDKCGYESNFPLKPFVRDGGLVFESTPDYLFHGICAKRIYQYNPEMRFIILLREPASRALSAWNMFRQNAPDTDLYDPFDFNQAISHEEALYKEKADFMKDQRSRVFGYLFRGLYDVQIERYFRLFKPKQFLFLENVLLQREPSAALERVCEFLGIPNQILAPIQSNVGRNYPASSYPKTIDRLRCLYRPHNERLFDIIGQRFTWNEDG